MFPETNLVRLLPVKRLCIEHVKYFVVTQMVNYSEATVSLHLLIYMSFKNFQRPSPEKVLIICAICRS